MTELLKKAPFLATVHEFYTNFTARERRRECALARRKAELDFASQREFAFDEGVSVGLEKGEAIGFEKGQAIGILTTKRDSVLALFNSLYPSPFVQSVYDRILQITNLAVLDDLFQGALAKKPVEELVKMF